MRGKIKRAYEVPIAWKELRRKVRRKIKEAKGVPISWLELKENVRERIREAKEVPIEQWELSDNVLRDIHTVHEWELSRWLQENIHNVTWWELKPYVRRKIRKAYEVPITSWEIKDRTIRSRDIRPRAIKTWIEFDNPQKGKELIKDLEAQGLSNNEIIWYLIRLALRVPWIKIRSHVAPGTILSRHILPRQIRRTHITSKAVNLPKLKIGEIKRNLISFMPISIDKDRAIPIFFGKDANWFFPIQPPVPVKYIEKFVKQVKKKIKVAPKAIAKAFKKFIEWLPKWPKGSKSALFIENMEYGKYT